MSVRAAGAPAAIAQSKSQWRASTGAPVQSTRRLDKVLAIGFAKITLNPCAKTSMMQPAPGDLTPDDQASADIQLDEWLQDVLADPPGDQLPTFPQTREEDELDELVEAGALDGIDDIPHGPDSAPAEGDELVDALDDEFLSDFGQHSDQLDESVVSPDVLPESQEVPGSSSENPFTTGYQRERYTPRQKHLLDEFFKGIKGMDEKLPVLKKEEIERLLVKLNSEAEDKVANEPGVRHWLKIANQIENRRRRTYNIDNAEERAQLAIKADVKRASENLRDHKLTKNAAMYGALEHFFQQNPSPNQDFSKIRKEAIEMSEVGVDIYRTWKLHHVKRWWELRMAYEEKLRKYAAHFQDQGSSQN